MVILDFPIYPYSIFYFTKSVFDGIGRNEPVVNKLLLKAILLNIRFKDKIGCHITYTTQEIMGAVKAETYMDRFKGFMQLGKNMALPEESEDVRGEQNFRLIQFAISRDGNILGLTKVIVNDYQTRQLIKQIIDKDNYPIAVVSPEEALEELEVIERRLYELFEK